MKAQSQATTGDWHPDMMLPYPYWSVIPPFPQPLMTVPYYVLPTTLTTNKTFADHIEIAKDAREAGKRMRRYRRIR